jgi:hypothetical protein
MRTPVADRPTGTLDFTRRSDLRLLAKSLRQGWPVEPDVRRQAGEAVVAILADPGARDDLRELAAKLATLLGDRAHSMTPG